MIPSSTSPSKNSLPIFEVVSRRQAEKLLHHSTLAGYTSLISIGDSAETRLPSFLRIRIPHRVRLEFDDVTTASSEMHGYKRASPEDIAIIIGFSKNIAPEGKTLIHCEAGISRSSAAAIIMATVKLFPDVDMPIRLLREYHPKGEFSPNEWMIALADRQLRLEGRLYRAVEDAFRPSGSPGRL